RPHAVSVGPIPAEVFVTPKADQQAEAETENATSVGDAESGAAASPSPIPAGPLSPGSGSSIPLLIVAAYGCGVALLLSRFLIGLLALVRLRRSACPVSGDVAELFRKISGQAGESVRLLASDQVQLPLAHGGWRPTIVLPASLCRDGEQARLRYALAHEWSH